MRQHAQARLDSRGHYHTRLAGMKKQGKIQPCSSISLVAQAGEGAGVAVIFPPALLNWSLGWDEKEVVNGLASFSFICLFLFLQGALRESEGVVVEGEVS